MLIKKEKRKFPKLDLFSNNTYIDFFVGSLILLVLFSLIYTYFYSGYISIIWYSHNSQKYDNPISLRLYKSVLNTEIRYTLDGTNPSYKSNLYIRPIEIDKSTSVRTQLFRNNEPIGDIRAKTILIKEYTQLPIISLNFDSDDLWNEETGIYVEKNHDESGSEWEKDGYLEFFDNNSKTPSFTREVEVRIYGGKSRRHPQRSLKVCTDDQTIKYEIFPNYNVNEFECLILRNSGNDWGYTMFRDGLMQTIVSKNSNVTTQNFRPSILFLNGKYWGIHNIREYYDEDYLANKYNGKPEDYSILFPVRKLDGDVEIEAGTQKDADDFYRLRDELVELDMNNPDVIGWISDLMDIDNFLEYNIFQIYFGNSDWPDTNLKLWRYTGIDKNENETPQNDGLFRWMIYDLDRGIALRKENMYDENMLKDATKKRDIQGRKWPYVILRRLLEGDNTRNNFINKFSDHLNSSFSPENMISEIDRMEKQIENDIPRHAERWGGKADASGEDSFSNIEDWRENVEKLRRVSKNGIEGTFIQIKDHFGLEKGTYNIEIYDLNNEMGKIKINSLNIDETNWTGTYFVEIPIEVQAIPNEGYIFKNWEGSVNGTKNVISIVDMENVQLKPIFEKIN